MYGLLIATLAAVADAPGTTGPAHARPLVSISAMPKQNATPAEFGRMILDLRRMGVRAMYISHKWGDLEPAEGKRDLAKLIEGVKGLTSLGFVVQLTIQTLDTNNRTLPADLASEPFDSPRMRARFASLLRDVAGHLHPGVRWVSLGNEVDIYLGEHRSELEPYARFVEEGRDVLRAAGCKALIGVTTTFDGLTTRRALCDRLNRRMDCVPITYYPLGPGFAVRPVGDVARDLDRMEEAANGRPWLLQEAGYPAAPLLGSSEDRQAAFIDALFEAAAKHAGRLQMMNVFLLHDFGDALVDGFLKYYRLPDARFRAYLATLGLKQSDGTPRKAWARFEAHTRAWAEPGR